MISMAKSMIDLIRDEIIERLDAMFYGPNYTEKPDYYITKN